MHTGAQLPSLLTWYSLPDNPMSRALFTFSLTFPDHLMDILSQNVFKSSKWRKELFFSCLLPKFPLLGKGITIYPAVHARNQGLLLHTSFPFPPHPVGQVLRILLTLMYQSSQWDSCSYHYKHHLLFCIKGIYNGKSPSTHLLATQFIFPKAILLIFKNIPFQP